MNMVKTLDKKTRLELLRQAPPEVQEMYGSEENGQVIFNAAEKLGIKGDQAYDTFALTVGDIILGSHSKEALGQMLKDRMDFNDEQVKIAEENLREFLNKIPKTTQPTTSSVIAVPPASEGDPDLSKIESDETENSKPEEDDTSVKPLRTFAMDVDYSRAHGYGSFKSEDSDNDENNNDDTPTHSSNQDDILSK